MSSTKQVINKSFLTFICQKVVMSTEEVMSTKEGTKSSPGGGEVEARQSFLEEVMTDGLPGRVGVCWLRKEVDQADLQRPGLRSGLYTSAGSTELCGVKTALLPPGKVGYRE